MQNDRSGSNSRRRYAAAPERRLQEASSNNEEELEARVLSSVRSLVPRRQRGQGRAEPPGNEEPAGPPSTSQPPALEYYRPSDEECEGQPALHADTSQLI